MTSPIDIRPDHLEIVQGILREHLPVGVKVWVFGSRANWTTKDSSDLDIALEGENKLSHKLLGTLKDAFEDSTLPYTVDFVDLNQIGDSFRQIVESHRVPLSLHRKEVKHPSAGGPEKDWLYHPQFPEHWGRRPLYSMAQWVNGLAFRNIQFSETGMPVIKIAEIKGGISGQTKFTEQTFEESVHVIAGDLLFSWSGQPETSIDAFWWKGPEGWLNQHIFRVTPEQNVDEAFFYYLLRYLRPNFVAIARNKQTTGLGHVTKQDLGEIEAALAPLPEAEGHCPRARHAGRQDRAEPAHERDPGGNGAGALQVVVRGLRARSGPRWRAAGGAANRSLASPLSTTTSSLSSSCAFGAWRHPGGVGGEGTGKGGGAKSPQSR